MNQTQPLDYYQAPQSAGSPPRFWIIPLVLGAAQTPWYFYWLFQMYDWNSLQPVRLVHDSFLYALPLALTFPSLVTGVICLIQARRTRHWRVLITGASVVVVSILLLAIAAKEWYSEVYSFQNGTYGLW